MYKSIPLSVPSIRGNEWTYVKDCLNSEWVSSAGKYVNKFEENICRFTRSKYAVACVNGTSALHISLLVAGTKPEDEVIVPTLTFIAPVNTIMYVGAIPVFMDCDNYYNIDTGKVVEFLKMNTVFKNNYTFNKTTGKRIAALIPVHVFGNAVNMEELRKICREYNIKIIEDATESLGTVYKNDALKNEHTGTVGDLGCLSFNGNKIITTGGGGMILTNDAEYAEKAKYLTTQAKDDDVNYNHNEIGYNYRLTNIQAALGTAQLEQLKKFIEIKKQNYCYYKNEIKNIEGISLAEVPDYATNNFWMYALQINKEKYGKNCRELMNHLTENNIQSRPVWQLNHLQKPYLKYQSFQIEKAYGLKEKTLNIPCSVNIKQEEIERVVSVLKNG